MISYKNFYLFSILGTLLISFYPLYMLAKVSADYIANGSVDIANYPKYIIPYTPISVALIISVSLMSLIINRYKKYALPAISVLSLMIFFISEILLENMVIIGGMNIKTKIENWQMLSCIMTPSKLTAGEILTGKFSPSMKIHFYIISIIIILAVLNVIYGFSVMIKTKNYSKKNPLIVQAVSIAAFLGLCIPACFTAFYRTGQLQIPAISAILMSLFFILMGMTSGIYIGSFFRNTNKFLHVIMPAIFASIITIVMYAGELILLNDRLYIYGNGFLFNPIGAIPFTPIAIPFAPIDLIIIVISGLFTYLVMNKLKDSK